MPVSRRCSSGVMRLEAEHHQVDAGQVLVAEPVAEIAVGVERGVDAGFLDGGEQLEHEAVLHQRLAAADGQAALHGAQAVAVLVHHLHRPRQASPASRWSASRCPDCGSRRSGTGNRSARPRRASPAHRPRNRSVNEWTKPQSPLSQRRANAGLADLLAERDAQVVGAAR